MNPYGLLISAILTAILALSACQPFVTTAGGTVPLADGTVPPVGGTIPAMDEDEATRTTETMGDIAPTADVNAGPNDNGAWVTLLQGETLAVTLEANRTTGYSWQVVEVDSTILMQQGEPVYIEPGAAMQGQAGSETFLFTAAGTGETTLQLVYQRPWETDVTPTPEQLYILHVVVEETGVEDRSSGLTGVLTGAVTYRQRIALLPGSVVDVQLQDVSRADAPAQVIASQTITTSGENVPIPFELTYDPAQIDPRFTYALRVRILVDGELQWINTEQYAVLTGGNPTDNVEVVVSPVR